MALDCFFVCHDSIDTNNSVHAMVGKQQWVYLSSFKEYRSLKMNWVKEIGAVVRWLLKGCKTSLKDEIDNDVANLIVGLLFSSAVVLVLYFLFK